jgi:hypothetical protein
VVFRYSLFERRTAKGTLKTLTSELTFPTVLDTETVVKQSAQLVVAIYAIPVWAHHTIVRRNDQFRLADKVFNSSDPDICRRFV